MTEVSSPESRIVQAAYMWWYQVALKGLQGWCVEESGASWMELTYASASWPMQGKGSPR